MDLHAPPHAGESQSIINETIVLHNVFSETKVNSTSGHQLNATDYQTKINTPELTINNKCSLANKKTGINCTLYQRNLANYMPQITLSTVKQFDKDNNKPDGAKYYEFRVNQLRNQAHVNVADIKWNFVEPTPGLNDSNDDQWIDPFDHNSNQGSPPLYPEWEKIKPTKIKSKGLAWHLVKESDVLAIDSTVTKAPRIIPALESVNRSIAFNTGVVGPDIGFLVPTGFRWSPIVPLDFSIRGWNRRPKGEAFIDLRNGDGDAVGQIFLQNIQSKKWSLGASLGIRSLYQGERFAGGASKIGEGISAGFRFDYALSDTAGIAIGAEQLIHFDNFTDTGRDIYLVASKGWWLGHQAGDFPLATATAGIGTGYLGRNPYLQFGCSNIIDAGIAQAGNPVFYPLCWGPIASGALVLSPKFSIFSEFNNFAFVTGASVAPFKDFPLRATWGVTLAQDFGGGTEDFRFQADRTRWFFRVSLGL